MESEKTTHELYEKIGAIDATVTCLGVSMEKLESKIDKLSDKISTIHDNVAGLRFKVASISTGIATVATLGITFIWNVITGRSNQ